MIQNDKENISLKQLLVDYIHQWKYFATAFGISILLAAAYLLLVPKTYEIAAKVELRPDQPLGGTNGGNLNGMSGILKSFGLGNSSSSLTIDDETAKSVVLEALDEALVGLVAMREKEGVTQVADISAKLDAIESALGEIASVAPQVVADYRAKLAARIREALGDNFPEESRIATEVALFADKCAIDEEISRLTAHIAAMRAHLKSTAPVGRKLDFLVQEMNREANTIGSKANDLRITERVLAIKNDIEKIREQAQNVE